jgi:outer membrane cobalamin receptor
MSTPIPIARLVRRAALLGLMAGSGPGFGADPPLADEMILFRDIPSVFAASKFEQKVTEAPADVSIVTATDIRSYGYRTLADILRSLRGFHVSNDRNYSYLGARGFSRPGDYNSRVLLLVDGHRINDNIYAQALLGTEFPVDVDLIDRVEVIRGPGSSLYGTGAFFGVINVITKRADAFKGTELSGEIGSEATHKGRASFGKRYDNGLEVVLSATGFHSRGQRNLFFEEFNTPQTNDGVARDNDRDGGEDLFANLAFGDFNLQLVSGSRTKQIPTASFGTVFDDPREHTVDTRQYVDLKYHHDLGFDSDVMARVFLDYYRYHGDYPFDYPPLTLNRDQIDGRSWGAEWQYATRLGASHRLVAGAEYVHNYRQKQANFDVAPQFTYLDSNARSKSWAAYLQDEFSIGRSLTLNAGVRYDNLYTSSTTNPRLALIYSPSTETSAKLLYGTAFRAPNAYELYYTGGDTFKTATGLVPERIKTTEIVLEQQLTPSIRGLAALFRNEISDLISLRTDTDGKLVLVNLDRVRAKGFELELNGRWDNDIEGRLSYTYQDARNAETGETLTNAPRHLGKLNLSGPLLRPGLFAGVELQYVSPRKTVQNTTLPGYVLTNLTLFSRGWLNKMELSASVYNVFDRKFADPGSEEHAQAGIIQDGRMLRLKLTYPF